MSDAIARIRSWKASVSLRVPREMAARLNGYLRTQNANPVIRSNHWQHYGNMNRVTVDEAAGILAFTAGAGFDGEYEFNFRTPRLKQILAQGLRILTGRDDGRRHIRAFVQLWGSHGTLSLKDISAMLGDPLSAQKILAAHYANLVFPRLEKRTEFCYLEIGAGSGYLAALIYGRMGGRVIVVDLPEILPFSFLYLSRKFPQATYVLPHEVISKSLSHVTSDFIFLTANQTHLVGDKCVDLAVNTASFGEMLPEQIAVYFHFLRQVLKPDNLFFTTNRVEKWMNRESTDLNQNVAGSSIAVRFDEYPWSSCDKDLFFMPSEFHALVQPQNPMLSRLCRLAPA